MKYILTLSLILLYQTQAPAAASGLQVNGFMYSDLGWVHDLKSNTKDNVNFRGMSVLGLGFKNQNRKSAKVEGDLDVILPYGEFTRSYTQNLPAFLAPVADSLVGSPLMPFIMDLRRLYISLFLPWADVTLGRQVVNFGKGLIFSPLDAFSSVEVSDLNFRRCGNDILRVQVPLGGLSGLSFTTSLPRDQSAFSSAFRVFTTVSDFDLSAVGLYQRAVVNTISDDVVSLGAAFKGDAIAGVTGEGVMHYSRASNKVMPEVMAGMDYSWSKGWFFNAEYLYKDVYLTHPLWGEHNAFASIQYKINDLMNVSCSLISVISKPAYLGMVKYYYNILQNANVTLYTRAYDGLGLIDMEYAVRTEVLF